MRWMVGWPLRVGQGTVRQVERGVEEVVQVPEESWISVSAGDAGSRLSPCRDNPDIVS
jgi:hypothetical protein